MYPYLLTFCVSAVIGTLVPHCRTKRGSLVVAIIAIMPLCLLAGLRATTVGIDTSLYPLKTYTVSMDHSLIDTISQCMNNTEPIFITYVWVITNSFHNFNILLFFLQLAIALPVAIVLVEKGPNNFGGSIIIYSFLVFPFTLNIIRQGIAFAFILLSYTLLSEGEKKWALACFILAVGFHTIAIVCLAIYPLYRIFVEKEDVRHLSRKKVKVAAILPFFLFIGMGMLFIMISGRTFIEFFSQFKGSYEYQLEHFGTGGLNITYLLLVAIIEFAILIVLQEANENDTEAPRREMVCLASVLLLSSLLSLLSILSYSLFRIGYMMTIFIPLVYIYLMRLSNASMIRFIIQPMLIASCILYSYWIYVNGGTSGVYPYASALLGI